MTAQHFDQFVKYLQNQGQAHHVSTVIAEADEPPTVKVLELLDGGPQRVWGRAERPL